MRPLNEDATTSIAMPAQSAGKRKSNSSSRKGKLFNPLADAASSSSSPAPSPSNGGDSGSRTAALAAATSVVVNVSNVNNTSGTSSPRDQVTGSSNASNSGNSSSIRNKQHSSSFSSPFGRFSLRRLLNPVNLTRTAMATTAAAVSSSTSRSASSARGLSAIDSSDAARPGRSSLCQYSSFDFDSNSISSTRTTGMGATTSEDHHHHPGYHHPAASSHAAAPSSSSTAGHPSSVMKQTSRDRSRHHSSSSSRKFSCVIQVSGAHSGPSFTCPPPAGRDNSSSGSTHRECPLCLLELPVEFFPDLSTCYHRACYDCLQQYLKIEISESRVMITCPECTELVHPNDIRMILNDESYTLKYEKFMLRRVLVAEPDARWCPAPDCGFVVIAAGCAGCPKLQCYRPGCDTEFCYHCKQQWHPNQTCDQARLQRSMGRRGSGDQLDGSHHHPKDTDIKPCPTCRVLIIKIDDGSCNHMTCSVCGTEFCWLCMKQISDLHYLSPSGCTFWGKKPWSRKKKILWQLGMLVGAPVGIALIAGIAVPAIVIGIPVWVGRKLHARLLKREAMARQNKNAIVATGVIASVCVSPLLALVAVGIGIPILLAYVYGVVPISLCRSGGCGGDGSSVPDSDNSRVEANEEGPDNLSTTTIHNTSVAPDEVSVDTALSNKVNPSIGEMSLGMSTSLSMGSGSHLDRVTCDRESASNAPLAGSIASATASNRLEIQADVSSSNKRFSISSETASCGVSLSERLSNSCALDDGASSVRACAGSIGGRATGNTFAANDSISYNLETSHSNSNHPHAETQSMSEVVVIPTAVHNTSAPTLQSSSLTALRDVDGNNSITHRELPHSSNCSPQHAVIVFETSLVAPGVSSSDANHCSTASVSGVCSNV